jgi:hypothetical protein
MGGGYARGYGQFIAEVRPQEADPQSYTRLEIIRRDDFIDLPPARNLLLTRQDMRMLVSSSDVWMPLAGALAHTITLPTTHVPKRFRKKQRTGGPDVWQLVYLGGAEVFVTK